MNWIIEAVHSETGGDSFESGILNAGVAEYVELSQSLFDGNCQNWLC